MAGRPLEQAAAALAARGVVAFTGAGISADSGVPTFRDPGGLWDRFDPERFGTWEGLAAEAMSHPDRLADFLGELRASFGGAGPNAAHRAIADLERAGLLTAVITQNVDGLHQEAGSLHVIEIHGSLHRRVCLVCAADWLGLGSACFTPPGSDQSWKETLMALFPSEEWLDLYVDRINQSNDYREAAATWEGDVAYVFEPEPDKGVPDEIWAWLDLWHGECRQGKLVSAEEGEKAKFIIRAPYSRWKEVINKELDPVKGMMQGKLKLKGDLPTIVRYVKAANELVNLAQTVPTEFADEQA